VLLTDHCHSTTRLECCGRVGIKYWLVDTVMQARTLTRSTVSEKKGGKQRAVTGGAVLKPLLASSRLSSSPEMVLIAICIVSREEGKFIVF
jgi:hypothetical protein